MFSRTVRSVRRPAWLGIGLVRHKSKLVGSLDQGTTSTRFILFDEHARSVAAHQMEHRQFYPRDGWVEHDPLEIIDNAVECIDGAVAKLAGLGYSAADVVSIGITNQRETTVVWDKHTGQPLHNAVVWLDLRTDEIAAQLSAEGVAGSASAGEADVQPANARLVSVFLRRQGPLPLGDRAPRIHLLQRGEAGLAHAPRAGDYAFTNLGTRLSSTVHPWPVIVLLLA